MAYYGDTMLLARSILWPDRSIIRQSYDARERLLDPSLPAHLGFGNLNADGFGIGWYTNPSPCEARMHGVDKVTPCTFKSITPAWNNDNLVRLATKIYSPLVFAHVRAAYPGMPVSEHNVRLGLFACLLLVRLASDWGVGAAHNSVGGCCSLLRNESLRQLAPTSLIRYLRVHDRSTQKHWYAHFPCCIAPNNSLVGLFLAARAPRACCILP